MNKIAIYICTDNDSNGNPRRAWAITDTITGEVVDLVVEGFRGRAALDIKYPGIVSTGRFNVTKQEYWELLVMIVDKIVD